MKKLFILLFIAASFSVAGHSQSFNYDVNGDGSVTVADVTAIYDFLLGSAPVYHEYVDLGLPSGTLWATMNVGATVPEDFGDYFAWGETAPKDVYDFNTYKWCMGSSYAITKYCTDSSLGYNGFVDDKTELDPEDDAAYVNWGTEWRMPSIDQIQELVNECDWQWTTRNGVNGRLATSKHNGASLFLPTAGYRWYDELSHASWGHYWSRTLYVDGSDVAYSLYFNSGILRADYDSRDNGQSVRAVTKEVHAQSFNYDVNGDGSVTVADVTAIYDFLLGNVPIENHEYVDLGLPSGTLWATTNVGASSPEGYGDYFAWGETAPKSVYDWSTYKWCDGSYNTLTKYCFNSSYGYNGFVDNLTELDPEDDAATAAWGAEWCMPSTDQILELLYYCTTEWTTRNGVNGCLFTSNINGTSLFLPAAGYCADSPSQGLEGLVGAGFGGVYSSRSLYYPYDTLLGTCLNFDSENTGWFYRDRNTGKSVRPVRVQQEPEHESVDLGLPSGTLWATMNIGANAPEDYGDYFAWGETEPKDVYNWSTYKWCNGSNNTLTKYCTDSNYGYNGFVDNLTELDLEDDVATINWGPEWRIPSIDQINELRKNCTTEWTTRNGVKGRLFTSNINGASLFLPAAGYRDGHSLYHADTDGFYWSRALYSSPSFALYLSIDAGFVLWYYGSRECGQSVRAVRVSQN